jgi:hypothetical protein
MQYLAEKTEMENLKQVGACFDGTPIYSFNYKGETYRRIGLLPKDAKRFDTGKGDIIGMMTDDVRKSQPDAVTVDPKTGVEMLDYDLVARRVERLIEGKN